MLSKRIEIRWKTLVLIALDIIAICLSYMFALWLRFDFRFTLIEKIYVRNSTFNILHLVIVTLIVFYFCRLYQSVWHLAGITEVQNILIAQMILIPCDVALGVFGSFLGYRMPISFYFIGYVLFFIASFLIRFSYRLLRRLYQRYSVEENRSERVMIIGGGLAGQMLIREYERNPQIGGRVVCIIDDDPGKCNKYLSGVKIVGDRGSIPLNVEKYQVDKILLAIAKLSERDKKNILDICNVTGKKTLVIPAMSQWLEEGFSLSQMREVQLEDLLGREPQNIQTEKILSAIKGRRIMVTGGGGSIGSEICRQVASAEPELLLIFDIYENSAYDIQQELKRDYPDLNVVVLIGSMRGPARVRSIMEKYRPHAVVHAAAHKHVPLMEDSPNEAVKNNVFGTYELCKAALHTGVKRFVMISTDKAVNPTNIMGASKRICEMIVQMMNNKGSTEFVAVRFGNVLGSNGSVVPLFKKQIAQGGPVTVTDPRIIRYFMTIPEAVSLVLQASYYARGGEIFVLDMGEPVKIDDMARNLIRLSGHVPDVDIKIEYTGLRPGEKLYEELLMSEEGLTATEHDRIHVAKPMDIDEAFLEEKLENLYHACYSECDNIRELVMEIVPTYHPAG